MCPGTGADATSKHASMRASFTTLATAIALWLAPQFALAAEDVETQLRQFRQVRELSELSDLDARLAGIQQQIETVEDDLEAAIARLGQQQESLEQAGLEPRQAGSGLSALLSETQFSGHLAASYGYNFNGIEPSASIAGGGRNGAGNLGLTAPFHAQGNNFQLDQLWLELLKPATAESRGGWAFTLVWGESADVINGNGSFDDDAGDFEFALQTPYIHRAYVEYLADVGSGVNVAWVASERRWASSRSRPPTTSTSRAVCSIVSSRTITPASRSAETATTASTGRWPLPMTGARPISTPTRARPSWATSATRPRPGARA